jgi:hypothetical protein
LLQGIPEFNSRLEAFPTQLNGEEEMERNLGDWRRMNILSECDRMIVNSKNGTMPQTF